MDELYEQIGRLKMELEWLKKKWAGRIERGESAEVLRQLIDGNSADPSIRRQCELLGLSRATLYYEAAKETEANLCLMRLIDEQYLETPFYGSRRMTVWLQHAGHVVNRKRVQRLLRLLRLMGLMGLEGLEAISPKPKLSAANAEHRKFPYLLRDLAANRVNQVWATDITYVPLSQGFMYLVAVIDWHSRYVLSWRLSNSLESRFCVEALEAALELGRVGVGSRWSWVALELGRVGVGSPGDLQLRSKSTVHEPGLHGVSGTCGRVWNVRACLERAGVSGTCGRVDQHGWSGPGLGQCVRGAAVVERLWWSGCGGA